MERDPQIQYKAFLFDVDLLRLIHADTLTGALQILRQTWIDDEVSAEEIDERIKDARVSFKMFVGRKPDNLWQMVDDDADGISWFGKAKWKKIVGEK